MVRNFVYLLLFICLWSGKDVFCQSDPRDSLKQLLKTKFDGPARVDLLNDLAYNNYDIDDSAGLHYAKEALALAQKINYPAGIKYAYAFIGLGKYCKGDINEALHYYQLSEKVVARNSVSIAVHNYILWSALHTDLANYDSAQLLLKRARAIVDMNSYADVQSIYKNMAHLLVLKSKDELAIQYLDSAAHLIKYGDVFMEMEIISHYGRAYQNLARYDKAKESYDKLCEIASGELGYYHKIDCRLNQSRLAVIKGDYTSALQMSLEALTMTDQHNYEQYVESLTQIGEVYLELTEYKLCAQYLFQALKISESAGLKLKTIIIYNNLAWLTKIEGQYDAAMEYTRKAEAISEAIDYKRGVAEARNVRGLTYFLKKDYARAMKEYDTALAIRNEINDIRGISATLYNRTEVYLELGQPEKALPILKRVMELEEKIGNKTYLAMTYGITARVLTDEKKYAEAALYLEKARVTGINQSLYIKKENASHFAYYYESLGDFSKALFYQKQFQQLADSIYSQRGIDKIAEYQALYKAENREKEIQLLNQKQKSQEVQLKLQESKLAQKNTIIIACIIAAILLGGASIRVHQLNIAKEAANVKLVSLNQEVSTQHRDIKSNLEHIQLLKAALEVREKQYRSLVEGASEIIHELDQDGKFIYINKAIERITGYTEKDLIGKHFSTVIHPDYVKYIVKIFVNKVKVKQEFSYLEFPVVSKEGKTIWLGQNTRFFFSDDKLHKVSVVARDISKQKEAEEALIKSQREYEDLVESIPIGIYKSITYPNGQFAFLYVSPKWCAMNNLNAYEVLNDPSLAPALIHPDDRLSFDKAEEFAKTNQLKFSWDGRIVVDGRVKYIHIESRATKLPDGTIIRNGIQQDITERKLAELEVAKAKDESQKVNASKLS